MKKETRRQFIENKLVKGLIVAALSPLSGFSKSNEQKEKIETLSFETYDDIDWGKIKSQFTIAENRRHFNTASIGPSPLVVQETTISTLRTINRFGKEQHKLVNETREKLAQFVNSNPNQIAITRNTTEGMNIIARSLKLKKGDEVIISSEEHVGGTTPWLTLQQEIGINVVVVDIFGKENRTSNLIEEAITPKTKVISLSHITCTTGTILPISNVICLCKKHQIISVIDGAQALGQIPLNLNELKPDFYVSSGHKWLFGPNGTGMLYLNKPFLEQTPPLFAGAYTDLSYDSKNGNYEFVKHASRYEYGTINAPIMAGLGSAVDFINQIGIINVNIRGKQLALRFRNGIKTHPKISVLTPVEASASTLTFTIYQQNSTDVCRSLIKNHSMVLRSVIENDLNAIRVSFAIHNDEKDVDKLIYQIIQIAEQS